MARRNTRKNQKRVVNTNASRRLHSDIYQLRHVSDYRTFTPEPVRYPLTLTGRPARLKVSKNANRPRTTAPFTPFGSLPHFGVEFVTPYRVIPCIRRKQKRETLFAKGIAGGPTSAFRRPKRTLESSVRC